MPALQLGDIPREAASIPTHKSELQGATLLQHDLFTNNVLYLEAALDLHPVPAHLLPLVPLFSRFGALLRRFRVLALYLMVCLETVLELCIQLN